MAANYSVFTKIFGEDGLSTVFRGVGNAAKSAFAPITAFNKAVGEPKSTELGKLGAKVDQVAGKFRTGLGSLAAWLPALGAIGSAASLGGLIAMTRSRAEGFEGLTLAAQKMGASVKDLALWRYGAKLAGVESEALDKGLVMLNRRMYDAATGKNKDVAALFTAMRVPLRGAKGEVLGVSESLGDIAEAFKRTGNASTREAMAIALFGRSGADLIPFLIKGKEGLAELRAEMAKYSGLSAKNAADLGTLAESYKRLDKAGNGLATLLSAVMAPHLIKIVDWTTNWIAANKGLIAQSIDRKLTSIGKAMDVVASAASAIGSLPFIDSFMKGADASTAFDVGLGILGVTMAGPVFSALQMIIRAVWGMNAALYANPFVLVAAAVAAVAYAIYANWGSITAWFGEQMDAISKAFDQGLGSGLWEIFKRFNAFNLIAEAVNGLSKWLFGIDLFGAGRALLQRLIDGVKSILPDFQAIWAPIDRAMSWVGNRWSAGAAAVNAAGPAFAGGGPDFPMLFQPTNAPSPGDVAAAPPQKVEASLKVDFSGMPRGVETSIDSKGIDDVSVGRSMGNVY